MKILERIDIGSLALENRLVMLATHMSMCEDGVVSQRLIDFYKARAKHKPGLIIVGGCYTEHLGMSTPTMIGLSEEKHEVGLSKLVDELHTFDVPVAAQLYHAGRYAHSLVLEEQAVSASEETCRLTRETPRALSIEEIQSTVKNFGTAALRAKSCGFDAVEIIGSAGYLINQFMALATNKRDDDYGGSLENRARFAIEIVKEVRSQVGSDFPVVYRISGEDFVPDGMKLEDNKEVIPWLVIAGLDAVNVTGGWHETRTPQITMDVPRGKYAYLGEGIAEVVDVPVVACNRINSVTIAEKILAREKVQLVGMSRGFIADSEIMEKIRDSRSNQIRYCIGCNLGCLDKVFMIEPVTCAINPQAGFESTRQLGPSGKASIAVVGAGAAGMEVSRVLALRGFSVTLYEKDDKPGGLLNLAARVPTRGEFATYVTHMWRELKRLRVNLQFESEATIELLKSKSYDSVFCATGTLPTVPDVDGNELPHVTSAYDVIRTKAENLGKVAILGGGSLGCHVGLYLALRADEVHLFEEGTTIGGDLGRTSRWIVMKNLHEKGVKIHKNVKYTQITSEYMAITEDDDVALYSIDTVVGAVRPQSNDRLVDSLLKEGITPVSVGTLVVPMNLLEVVHNAFITANDFILE